MNKINFQISNEIFSLFPDYCRGLIIVKNIKNSNSPPELINKIREQEIAIRKEYNTEKLLEDERIKSWREAYRRAGIKPSEFRCSIEAMLRRVLKDQPLPAINKLVDLGNYFSLKYFIPIGCHSLDDVHSDMTLRLAKGTEKFTSFGTSIEDNPSNGEIIFADGDEVMTRRWTWRQSNHTIITNDSSSVEYNIDGMPPVTEDIVKAIGGDLTGSINDLFGNPDQTFNIISKNKQELTFEI